MQSLFMQLIFVLGLLRVFRGGLISTLKHVCLFKESPVRHADVIVEVEQVAAAAPKQS